MTCLLLEPTLGAFANAANDLVRTQEVAHLVHNASNLTPERVGGWIARERRSGRLRYLPDTTGKRDHWCSPLATLKRGGGDCEDLAILAVSLLRLGSLQAWVCVGWRVRMNRRESHAWVEARTHRGAWRLIEATTGKVYDHRPAGYSIVRQLA